MDSKKHRILLLVMWIGTFSIGFFIDPFSFKIPNIWSYLPIALLYLTVLITKNYYISFFLATLLSLVFTDKYLAFSAYANTLIDVCSNESNVWLILDILLIGGLINIIKESNFIEVIRGVAEHRINRKTFRFILLMSALLSFDDYFFPSMLSSAIKNRTNIKSRDKNLVAFLSRGATISFANYNPISWPIYTMGLLVYNGVANTQNAYYIYYNISVFAFFPIVLILILYLQGKSLTIYSVKDNVDDLFIKCIDRKTINTILSFFLPVAFHMIFSIIIGDTLPSLLLTVVLTSILYAYEKKFTFLEIPNIIISGCKNMFEICLIIILSLVFSESINNINFINHTITLVSRIAQPKFLPFVVFLFFSITEYFFSLNWSLWLIIFPILIEVCAIINANLYLTLGAVLSAGILGSISCVYSDSSVLSINCFSLDIRFHAKYTLFHVLPAIYVSALLYLLLGLLC